MLSYLVSVGWSIESPAPLIRRDSYVDVQQPWWSHVSFSDFELPRNLYRVNCGFQPAPFAKVHIIKDNTYVYTAEPGTKEVEFTWRDAAPERGKQSYYYVRGEQQDGEIVWVSPMWITYTGN